MNEFDKRMRARARAEDCPIPAGFDGRLETLLEELPERQAARKPRRLRRAVVAAALAAALCVGGVAAASGRWRKHRRAPPALSQSARRGLLGVSSVSP